MRGIGLLVAVVFASVVTAACGGSSASLHQPGVVSSPTTDVAKRTDKKLVASVVLRATDLPGSWTQGRVVANDNSGDAQMSHCLGISNDDADRTANIGSPSFNQGATYISSQTYVYRSEDFVHSDVRGFNMPQLAWCFTDGLTSNGFTNVHITKVPLPSTAARLQACI